MTRATAPASSSASLRSTPTCCPPAKPGSSKTSKPKPGGSSAVQVAERDNEAIIEVTDTDTGIGIAGEELPHIFERFWRGERSRARKTGGAGIGLAIVRELVRAHDGRIDMHSKPGEGSRFTVTLPTPPPGP